MDFKNPKTPVKFANTIRIFNYWLKDGGFRIADRIAIDDTNILTLHSQ